MGGQASDGGGQGRCMECEKRIGAGAICTETPKSLKVVGRRARGWGCHYSIKNYGQVGSRVGVR